jgi:hypothetical protein
LKTNRETKNRADQAVPDLPHLSPDLYSEEKFTEKLRYMHQNPVKRGLVLAPEDWKWSSYRTYTFNERGAGGAP